MAGYYTLDNKFVAVSAGMLSNTLKKRITKFSQYDPILDRYLISMPLIAQLGKNYSDTAKENSINGNDLLDLACQNIKKVGVFQIELTKYQKRSIQPSLSMLK